MKIILKEPVYKLGVLGDVVNVTGGYARNYLLPRGMALVATQANINQFEAERESIVKKLAHLKSEAETVADVLNTVAIEFTRKSSDEDKIFGSVTSMDIVASLKEAGHDVVRRNILLPSPIKAIGETKVKIKLDQSVLAEISVSIIAEAKEEGDDDASYSVAPYPEDAAEVAAAEEDEWERKPRRAKKDEDTTKAPEAKEADSEAATEEATTEKAPEETPTEAPVEAKAEDASEESTEESK